MTAGDLRTMPWPSDALMANGKLQVAPPFVFDGNEEITTEDLTGEPQYQCSDGGCLLTGATVYIQFPANAFTTDSATIDITPREGDPVSVDFDLSSVR